MSDLQCPARVYLARNDLPPGRVRSAVEGEQIAAEYAVPPDHPVGSAWLDDIIDRHRGEAVLVPALGVHPDRSRSNAPNPLGWVQNRRDSVSSMPRSAS